MQDINPCLSQREKQVQN